MDKNKYVKEVLDTIDHHSRNLSLENYIDALEEIQEDIDTRLVAAREDLDRE